MAGCFHVNSYTSPMPFETHSRASISLMREISTMRVWHIYKVWPSLRDLSLSCNIGDAGLVHIGVLTWLFKLHLVACENNTDDGLASLHGMSHFADKARQ